MKTRWRARGGNGTYGKRPMEGQIIGLDFRAWRVTGTRDVLPIDPDEPQYILEVKPIGAGGSLGDQHIMTVTERKPRSEGNTYYVGGGPNFNILPEHYSVCGVCGDVQPCREEWAAAEGDRAMKEFARFDQPGACPACQEPITSRQKSLTLPNIVNPLGGTVTFHRRWKCLSSAIGYEKRLLDAGAVDSLKLSCSGRLIQHRDNTLECLDLECPDTAAQHGNFTRCQYRSHGCPRFECNFAVTPTNKH